MNFSGQRAGTRDTNWQGEQPQTGRIRATVEKPTVTTKRKLLTLHGTQGLSGKSPAIVNITRTVYATSM